MILLLTGSSCACLKKTKSFRRHCAEFPADATDTQHGGGSSSGSGGGGGPAIELYWGHRCDIHLIA
jgi:hypothetical protein